MWIHHELFCVEFYLFYAYRLQLCSLQRDHRVVHVYLFSATVEYILVIYLHSDITVIQTDGQKLLHSTFISRDLVY